MPIRRLLLAASAATVAALALPSIASAIPATCPVPYRVDLDDSIISPTDTLDVPRGTYTITVSNVRGGLNCRDAAIWFGRFIAAYPDTIPASWDMDADDAKFTYKRNPAKTFRVGLGTSGGRPPTPTGFTVCPGRFQVLHDDVIGPLSFPAGFYNLLRGNSSPRALTCGRISTLFASFLQRPDGRLPGGWSINKADATFRNGSQVFRVDPIR